MESGDRRDKPSLAADPLLGFMASENPSDPVAAPVLGLPQVTVGGWRWALKGSWGSASGRPAL